MRHHPVDRRSYRRAGVRQRVPLRTRRRRAALPAPAHRARSAQRQARHCRRDHAGPGRRGRARRRRCGASRSAAAAGRRPRVRRVGADRRGCGGGEAGRADRVAGVPGGAALLRVHGHGRQGRKRPGGRRRNRRGNRFRGHRDAAGRAAARDGVPDRPAAVLDLPRARDGRDGRRDLRGQRRDRPRRAGLALVRAVHRSGDDAAAPAGDRDREPLHRRATAGAAEDPRQAAGRHRGPRRHRRALHGQDRHADRRQDHLRLGARHDGRAVGSGPARWSRVHRRRPLRRPDRQWQPARPRSLGVLRCGEVGAAGRRAPRRAAVRLRAPPRVGARAGRRRAPHHRQGRARRGACPVHGRGAASAGRARPAVRAGQPRRRRRHAARRWSDATHARRRTGPRAGGLPDVRGPSEGRCGRGAQAACATERRGEGDHGRQRPRCEEGVRGHRPQGERNDYRLRAGRARRRRARPAGCLRPRSSTA